jgi:hypothetical protein
MAFTAAGLANGGVTTHYRFQYDDSLQQLPTNPNEPESARTNLSSPSATTISAS